MAIVNTLKIYEDLKAKFNEEQAKVVVEVIEKSFEEYRENQKEFLVTKIEFNEAIARLEKRIEESKFDLLKWFIVMWVTLIIAMGIFKFF